MISYQNFNWPFHTQFGTTSHELKSTDMVGVIELASIYLSHLIYVIYFAFIFEILMIDNTKQWNHFVDNWKRWFLLRHIHHQIWRNSIYATPLITKSFRTIWYIYQSMSVKHRDSLIVLQRTNQALRNDIFIFIRDEEILINITLFESLQIISFLTLSIVKCSLISSQMNLAIGANVYDRLLIKTAKATAAISYWRNRWIFIEYIVF